MDTRSRMYDLRNYNSFINGFRILEVGLIQKEQRNMFEMVVDMH
jgi:hypothetical protein